MGVCTAGTWCKGGILTRVHILSSVHYPTLPWPSFHSIMVGFPKRTPGLSIVGRVMSVHAQLCLTLSYPMDCSLPGSSVHGGFSRQEYWSGFPFPPSGDLPNPGIEPMSPMLAGRYFTTEPLGKPNPLCKNPKKNPNVGQQ